MSPFLNRSPPLPAPPPRPHAPAPEAVMPHRRARTSRRRPLYLERLEERCVPTAQPVSLADPGFYGDSGNGQSGTAVVSADRRYVAFASAAGNLVANDSNGTTLDVFVRDRTTGATALVSVNQAGTGSGDAQSRGPLVMSPNGRYVAFYSEARDLTGDSNSNGGTFVRDLQAGTTTLLGGVDELSFCADGHLVAYR